MAFYLHRCLPPCYLLRLFVILKSALQKPSPRALFKRTTIVAKFLSSNEISHCIEYTNHTTYSVRTSSEIIEMSTVFLFFCTTNGVTRVSSVFSLQSSVLSPQSSVLSFQFSVFTAMIFPKGTPSFPTFRSDQSFGSLRFTTAAQNIGENSATAYVIVLGVYLAHSSTAPNPWTRHTLRRASIQLLFIFWV